MIEPDDPRFKRYLDEAVASTTKGTKARDASDEAFIREITAGKKLFADIGRPTIRDQKGTNGGRKVEPR